MRTLSLLAAFLLVPAQAAACMWQMAPQPTGVLDYTPWGLLVAAGIIFLGRFQKRFRQSQNLQLAILLSGLIGGLGLGLWFNQGGEWLDLSVIVFDFVVLALVGMAIRRAGWIWSAILLGFAMCLLFVASALVAEDRREYEANPTGEVNFRHEDVTF